MSSIVVAFLFAAGVTAWVYSKTDRRTGGNTQSSVTIAVLVFVVTLFVGWSIMDMISG